MIQRSRYARQEAFTGIGRQGQERLRGARVLLVGTGALGSALAETLVRGGVGQLTIVDRDVVEISNLQRQLLFDEEDVCLARPKAVAAARALSRLNSEVTLEVHVADVDQRNVSGFVRGHDLVLDGTDNLATRYVINDACLGASVPWIYSAVVASHGLVLSVRPKLTPCLRCVLGDEPPPGLLPTCETEGILAPAVMAVAAVAGAEALKLLVGCEKALLPGLVSVDVWDGVFEVTNMQGQAPSCRACTQGLFDAHQAIAAGRLCGSGVFQMDSRGPEQTDLSALASRLALVGEVVRNEHLVRLRASDAEITVFSDGRTLVRGARDQAEARGLVARYIGS